MYVLHVCMSIKIHCLLNTGLLPTCRNMHKHTLHTHRHKHTHTHTHTHTCAHAQAHTHTHVHTDTTLLHKLWDLTCRCVSLKGEERSTWVPTSRGGCWALQQAHACPRHAASTWTRPTQDLAPATHSSSFQPPSETEPAALRGLGGGRMRDS